VDDAANVWHRANVLAHLIVPILGWLPAPGESFAVFLKSMHGHLTSNRMRRIRVTVKKSLFFLLALLVEVIRIPLRTNKAVQSLDEAVE